MARSFAAAGARVSLAARSAEALGQVAAQVRGTAFTVDLLDPTQVDALVPRVEAEAGPIDVLVNNAGLESSQWLRKETAGDIRNVVRLNLEVPMVLSQAALPGMLARGKGSLVYVSSLAGTAGFPGMTVYAGTKGGLTNFAASVRIELRDTPVNVTLVAAGPVDTSMWDRLEDGHGFDAIIHRFNSLHLIPKKSPELLARRTVAAVAADRRHVRVPRRLLATYWMGEAPRRLSEVLLTGVRFDQGD
jgi:short-subunit dehydrogenase